MWRLEQLYRNVGRALAIGFLLTLAACIGSGVTSTETLTNPSNFGTNSGNFQPNPGNTPTPTPTPTPQPGQLTCAEQQINHVQHPDGSTSFCVPPLHLGEFVYLRLQPFGEVFPANPQQSLDWDIAVKNWVVKVNGGAMGIGDGEVAYLTAGDFSAHVQAPQGIYYTELPNTGSGFFEGIGVWAFMTYPPPEPDENYQTGPIYAGMWKYSLFQPPMHTLRVRDALYFLRGLNDQYYKIRPISAYKDLGNGGGSAPVGYFSFRIGTVAAP